MLIEVDQGKMLTVAAVLPLQRERAVGLAREIQLAEDMAAILTLDRALARSEEASFVFGTENSHCRCSL
jgi:hypothetical protein